MFVPSVYDIIETVNSFFEILIVAFFYHRIFERKYNSIIIYIISYAIAFAVLMVSTLNASSPYIRIGISFVILLSL